MWLLNMFLEDLLDSSMAAGIVASIDVGLFNKVDCTLLTVITLLLSNCSLIAFVAVSENSLLSVTPRETQSAVASRALEVSAYDDNRGEDASHWKNTMLRVHVLFCSLAVL